MRDGSDVTADVLHALPVPVVLSSLEDGLVLFANEHAARAFGIPLGEFIGSKTPSVYADRNDRDEIVRILRREGRLQDHEVLLRGAGDSRFWALATAEPLTYDGLEVLCTTFIDITQRKRAEQAIQAAREFAENVVETIRTPIAVLDRDLRVLSINRSFSLAFRISPAEARGRPFLELGDGVWDLPQLRELLTQVIPAQSEITDFEVKCDLPAVGARALSINATKLYRPGNHTDTIFLSIEDVTHQKHEREDLVSERRHAQEERDAMEAQMRAAQRMEAVGRLAGGIAHDFNNVLMVMQSYATFLRDEFREGDPARDDVETILDSARRAARLTSQLLAFSRRQVQELTVTDLNELVGDLDKMLQRLIGEDIDLVANTSRDVSPVRVDISQIEQILMNLAVNARDAMPRGGKLTIETANVELDESYGAAKSVTIPAGRYVMLAVSDTGAGMDRETQSKIFEPFFTTKEKGKGTGLGLSTVYGIVKQSGGYIWVYSELGRGTTFKIYLPRVEEEALGAPRQPAPTELRGTETLLVVEDEDAVRKATARILKRHGYRVLEADGRAEALDLVRRSGDAIDLLLTDVVLPQTSGRDLADEILESHPDIKVIFTSGYTDNAIVHHGVLDEGTVFLQKPFTPQALLTKIRATLDEGGSL